MKKKRNMKHEENVALTIWLSHMEVSVVQVRLVKIAMSYGSTWYDSSRVRRNEKSLRLGWSAEVSRRRWQWSKASM